MAQLPPTVDPSVDNLNSRGSTKVYLAIRPAGGVYQRIGRVQTMREDINNNVQVISELGRDYAVELKKGVTLYTFTLAKFFVRKDVFDDLKRGMVFALQVRDASGVNPQLGAGGAEILEAFQRCMITTLSRDYGAGQAVVGENATVVIAGQSQVPGQPVAAATS